MTDNSTTQAVVDETQGAAQPAPTVTDARDDGLDEALQTFDAANKPKPATQPATTQAAPDNTDVIRRVSDLEKQLAEKEFQTDIVPVIKNVRGDIPQDTYDDDDVRDWLDRQARNDPRLQQAWLDRKKSPAEWAKVEKGLQRKLAAKFEKQPDKNVTEDVAAVTAAMRGTSTKTPPATPPDYSKLNNNEFANEIRKLGLSF